MEPLEIETHCKAIEAVGYTVLENAIPEAMRRAIRRRVTEIERETLAELGPGETEAASSFVRTAGLFRLDPLFWEVPIHEDVLQILQQVLGEDFLLSTFSAIDVRPNRANTQPLHPDDALIPLQRPHERAIGCTCMWIISDFNAKTGGTRLIPGSHSEPIDLLFTQDPAKMEGMIQPDLRAGSILMFDHALFHGAADNHSDDWRLGLQVSYHAGWIRPYTNWFRSIPVEEVATYPQRLADLLGYKTYHGIGSANKTPGSYRESYTGNRTLPTSRLPLD